MSYRGRKRAGTTLASAALSAALVAGCGGGGKDFADQPRPAAPIQLNGVITKDGVNISPNRVGAGPVDILVSNQTNASHTLTLDGGTIATVRTDPIAPANTGHIQITLQRGVYTVKAGSLAAVTRQLRPARLVIGRPRPDSNDQVGLP